MEWLWGIGLIVLVSILVCLIQNKMIGVTTIEYKSSKLPRAFDGYTILHISDFHNMEFGSDQAKLMKQIRQTKADSIVITGDLLDRRHPDMRVVMDFVQQIVKLAPVYYVSGNHEIRSGYREKLLQQLAVAGVVLMDDRMVLLKNNGASVELYGLKDPFDTGVPTLDEQLQHMVADRPADTVKILLCHRPELLNIYAAHDIDLAFAGHAHGGLVRLPGIKGLIAPNQGFFPKYTAGAYTMANNTMGNTTMIVSRGLGNNLMPFRVGNPPELVLVTLRSGLADS